MGYSSWSGGTTYVSANDVLTFLKIQNAQQTDINLLDNIIIPNVCDYIDKIAGTTWGLKTVQNKTYSIGKPTFLGWFLTGSPVYLKYYPIVPYSQQYTLGHLGVWNGQSYNEWVGTMVESRWGSYWVDTYSGILWIIGWYWYMGYEVNVTFNYGYNTAGTNEIDGQVYNLALYKASKMFLDNERYTAIVSQGIGGIDMNTFWGWLNTEIPKLEDAIRGLTPITGSWLA